MFFCDGENVFDPRVIFSGTDRVRSRFYLYVYLKPSGNLFYFFQDFICVLFREIAEVYSCHTLIRDLISCLACRNFCHCERWYREKFILCAHERCLAYFIVEFVCLEDGILTLPWPCAVRYAARHICLKIYPPLRLYRNI